MLRNPRVRLHALNLLAQVRLKIVESIEMGRLAGNGTRLLGQARPEFVLLHFQQSAVGVVDDDELLRVQQVMRNNQRAQRVIGGNSAGIANHVRVPRLQPQAAFKQDSGIHTGQHS
jgi:hypothetical protein